MDTVNVQTIAEICHEANRVYCRSLGDDSQPRWEYALTWQRESAIKGVQAILEGRVKTARESHDSWLQEKSLDGWSYGPVKDVAARTHPCFLPYDELPADQRRKDDLLRGIVGAFLPEPVLRGQWSGTIPFGTSLPPAVAPTSGVTTAAHERQVAAAQHANRRTVDDIETTEV